MIARVLVALFALLFCFQAQAKEGWEAFGMGTKSCAEWTIAEAERRQVPLRVRRCSTVSAPSCSSPYDPPQRLVHALIPNWHTTCPHSGGVSVAPDPQPISEKTASCARTRWRRVHPTARGRAPLRGGSSFRQDFPQPFRRLPPRYPSP